jgi:ubiquinone/menaquinone biosynthesis C-methylase UbiE
MPGDVWKRIDVALKFTGERSRLIPDRARQMEIVLRLLQSAPTPPRRILDVGSGDAILLAALLETFPEASGVALDFSPPMLDQARKRLASFGPRAAVVEADLSTPAWQEKVARPFDAVVSGFAIHHLPHDRKRKLYEEIFNSLADGGSFVNCEHVASATPRLERLFDEAMSEHLWKQRSDAGENVTREQVLAEYLTRPDRAANILAPVEEQCRWLRDIGFEDVDCYWKYLELAVFGGRKC